MTDGLLSGREFSQPFRHGSYNLVILSLLAALFHTQILGLGVHYVHMIGTVEHIHIITLPPSHGSVRIEGIAIVQDGTASVLGHNDIHIIRFSVNHKLYLVSFLLTNVTSATRSPICISILCLIK